MGPFRRLSQSATHAVARHGRVTIPTGNHPTASKLEILDLAPTAPFGSTTA